ncbi:transient receptor potential cation channel protein painless-like [Plodia interpunctella]|uniref:transient receptor potential cation channel protein painless-like n=1 Tax=Plodia interpunctella TaxID=58824 RepID=UPI00236814D7|nr:transient receptor potential cation channel protein painless-like [Plodia interpunctella]XP_053600351.1 transient receptor potential cation channel protein painless-like [Plodia interpunctella]XP_053600352.1 transient receptor potential cation channel protein painless-like [Plodia interpunctella]
MTRDSYEMNSNRLSRGGSLFGADPQVQLRTALRTNDFLTFKKLIDDVDLEYVYQYPDYKTCLEIAVSEPNKQNFVKLLLQHQVQVNNINETHGAAPIHFAVDSGNIEALKLLLEDDRIDVNNKSKANTALLKAIKKIEDLDDRDRELELYEDMVELLVKAGCNVNSPDLKGITPIYLAAKQGLERVITFILDYSKDPIDLDTYKDRRGKTARHFLKEAFPYLLAKVDANAESIETIDNDKLFYYLSRHEEENFIRDFRKLVSKNEHRSALTSHNGMHTMLQLSVEKGFEKVVETLLTCGADPNATFSENNSRPVAIACQNGFSKILKMFIENDSTLFDPINGETLIQITIKGMGTYYKNPKANFKECMELLLKHPKINIDVNHQDIKNNTALHYAARNGDSDTVLDLLRKGACIGLRNQFNEPPLADINAKTLEMYLDECITSNDERPSDDDYEIHMKYSFLVYPNNSFENELNTPLIKTSNNNVKAYDAVFAPETDALLYMTRCEELKPLLKHPVITSFLYLKWQRISCLFYGNITFYSLFWLSLILYIILGYGVEKKQSESIEMLNVVTHIGAIIGLIVLVIRELFQLLVSPTRYLQSIENWMEVALIFVTIWIVCYDSAQESTKQQLSAVAILLSSAELVLLIGQFPTLSTNIVMLKTVSWNFFKFLLWYCILIIAFALSFYTLFRQVIIEDQKAPNPNETGKDEEEEDFFEDPGRSLFKTIVMLTGEFDAGSIKFSTFPVTSHIIFIVFVFMIPIVLFNLLNGLAVSDTQAIRADAELVGHISQIKLISYFESVLLGNSTEYTQRSRCWSCMPLNWQNFYFIKPKTLCLKPFAKRITLFPHFLPLYKILVKPNQDNRIVIPEPDSAREFGDDYEDIENGQCCFERCQNYRLERTIVNNAKCVISKRTNVSEYDEMKQFVKSEIDSMKEKVQKMLELLESKY